MDDADREFGFTSWIVQAQPVQHGSLFVVLGTGVMALGAKSPRNQNVPL